MLAQLAISAVETLVVARLGIHELAGVALALSIDLLMFLATLGVVTAVTPLAAAARGRGDFKRLRRIAAALVAQGIPPLRGGNWHPSTVNNLLQSENV